MTITVHQSLDSQVNLPKIHYIIHESRSREEEKKFEERIKQIVMGGRTFLLLFLFA